MKPLSLKLKHLEPKLLTLLRAEVGHGKPISCVFEQTKYKLLPLCTRLEAANLRQLKDEESKT